MARGTFQIKLLNSVLSLNPWGNLKYPGVYAPVDLLKLIRQKKSTRSPRLLNTASSSSTQGAALASGICDLPVILYSATLLMLST